MLLTENRPQRSKAARTFEETITMLDSGSTSTVSGVYVTTNQAMRQATYYSCIRLLSEIIAQLPIDVQTRKNGMWITSDQHHLLELFASPNDWQTQHDLIAMMVAWSEMAGNSFGYKVYSGDGIVRKLIPIESDSCSVRLNNDMSLTYSVTTEIGIQGDYSSDRIFHLRNFGTKGYVGLSTVTMHREGIGFGLQLEKHATAAYRNGLQTSKWVKLDTPLHGEPLKAFKEQLETYQGAINTGKMPALSGAEIKEFKGISQVDAQWIESRKMQKEEIATIFLVPIFLLNSTSNTTWGSGLEQISRSFVRFSLNPRLNRLGQTLIRELVPEKNRSKTRIVFDTDQFTLGDFKDRMDGYRSGIESGVLSPNECREVEGRNARDGGNKYRQPVNIAIEGETNDLQNNQ